MAIEHARILTSSLSSSDRRRMFALMEECYLGMDWEEFNQDLAEKDEVMILSEGGEIVGFSTLVMFDFLVGEQFCTALFSGDTVVSKDKRINIGFAKEIVSYFYQNIDPENNTPVYWTLISKGWRTFRILPFLFKEFYPNPFAKTENPRLKEVRDAFGKYKYPKHYKKRTGLIQFPSPAQRLKPRSEEAECNRDDPYAKFFFEKNPGYLNGDELVCVAEVSLENFTRSSLRLLGEKTLV